MGSIPATPSTKHASCFPPSNMPASIEISIKLIVCLSAFDRLASIFKKHHLWASWAIHFQFPGLLLATVISLSFHLSLSHFILSPTLCEIFWWSESHFLFTLSLASSLLGHHKLLLCEVVFISCHFWRYIVVLLAVAVVVVVLVLVVVYFKVFKNYI